MQKWDSTCLDETQAGFLPERRRKDAQLLRQVFSDLSALHAPMVDDALDWARLHGVRFFVDRTCHVADGYYAEGTGVVALSSRMVDYNRPGYFLKRAGEVLVHEIRHAWQDEHGLLPTVAHNAAEAVIKVALIEADAMAHGSLAFEQIALIEAGVPRIRTAFTQPQDRLADNFCFWYALPRRAGLYGVSVMKHAGAALGVPGIKVEDSRYDLKLSKTMPQLSGIDLYSLKDILPLGHGFTGIPKRGSTVTSKRGSTATSGGYLDSRRMRDFLLKTALSPTCALAFYKAANAPAVPLAQAVRKADLSRGKRCGEAFSIA